MGSKLFWSLLFGLVIIVLLAATLYVRSIAPGSRLPRPSPAITQAPTPSTQPLTLALTSPEEETVLSASRVRVAGITAKKAIVVITGGSEPTIIDADEAGSFAADVQLESGVQTLTITAFNPDTGEEASSTVNVVVAEDGASTQSISQVQETEDARAMEELRAKLATRTAQVADSLPQRTRAFVGLIQSIDSGTIVVITKTGSKTVTLDPSTTIVNKGVEVNSSSLKEGSRIAAIGESLDGKSLKAKRIIIPQSQTIVWSIIGDITDSVSGKLTIRQLRKNELVFLILDANTSLSLRGGATTTSSVLKAGARVVAVGTSETPETMKTIRIVVVTTPVRDEQPRSTGSAEAQSVLAKAKSELAQNRGASEDLFELVHFSAQTWGDTSLGVPQAGEVYAQVLTPGYKIIFESPVSRYEIHTDAAGSSMVVVDPYTRLVP